MSVQEWAMFERLWPRAGQISLKGRAAIDWYGVAIIMC